VFHDFGWKNFQCDFAVESGVVGEVNLTHTAGAELRADFVAANFFMRGERQRACSGGVFSGPENAAGIVD
jgi:hypothetical protein